MYSIDGRETMTLSDDFFMCELCPAEGVRTIHGVTLCESCDPEAEEDECEAPHWPNEIPSGLLDSEDGETWENTTH